MLIIRPEIHRQQNIKVSYQFSYNGAVRIDFNAIKYNSDPSANVIKSLIRRQFIGNTKGIIGVRQ